MSNSKKSFLEGIQEIKLERGREQFYKYSIDYLFNSFMLENEIDKCNCDSPLEDNPNGPGRRIGALKFENTKVRKIMDAFDKVLNLSLEPSDVRDELIEAVLKCNRSGDTKKKGC